MELSISWCAVDYEMHRHSICRENVLMPCITIVGISFEKIRKFFEVEIINYRGWGEARVLEDRSVRIYILSSLVKSTSGDLPKASMGVILLNVALHPRRSCISGWFGS